MRRILLVLSLLTLVSIATCVHAADYVWFESENPTTSNLKPTTQWADAYLSGTWIQYDVDGDALAKVPDEGIQLQYDFLAPTDGDYALWHRVGFEHLRPDIAWRIDDHDWVVTPHDKLTIDLMKMADWCDVSWLEMGNAQLTHGAHKLQLKITKAKNPDGKWQRILYTSDCFCLCQGHFTPNNKYKPDQDWRSDTDRQAAAKIFTLPTPTTAADRATVTMNGLWEVTRDDEYLTPKDVATPIPGLPADPRFSAIQVPGDKDLVRPDLEFAHRLWYHTRVSIADGLAGRAFYLTFPDNSLNTTVFVNGTYCGFNKNPFARFDIDISKAVKPGINEVWVGIRDCYYAFHNDPNDPLVLRKKFYLPQHFMHFSPMGIEYPVSYNWHAGILETPILTCCGAVYTAEVFCKPSVAKKQLAVDLTVRNTSAQAVSGEVLWQAIDAKTKEVAQTFTAQPFTVAANSNISLAMDGAWANPKLWWPDSPQMYLLRCTLLVDGKSVDVLDTSFGFREWSIAGIDFLLNGIKWHGWADCHVNNDKDAWLAFQRLHNITMVRYWNAGWEPWYDLQPEDALNYFDNNGVVVRRTSVWDGESMNYATPSELFCQNMKDQLVQWVKAQRNHPSIMIWSLENELSFIAFFNSGQSALWEPKLSAIAKAIEEVDPSRPVMVDGGGATQAQTLPVQGDHYTTGPFPAYPALAYQPNETGGGRGRWQWDMKRPRFIGEELYASGINPDFAYFGGENVFQGKEGNKPAVGLMMNILTQGYRWNHIGAFHFWDGVGDATGQYASFAARAVFCRQWDWTFGSGQRVTRTFKLFNDTHFNDPITFSWVLVINGKTVQSSTKTYQVPAGEDIQFNETIPMPLVNFRTDGQLILTLQVGGKQQYQDIKAVSILNPLTHYAQLLHGKQLPAVTLAVFDPQGNVLSYLQTQKMAFTQLHSLDSIPAGVKILVVGKDALSAAQSSSSQLAAFAADGHTVIVLEQRNALKYQGMPAEIALAPLDATQTTVFGGYKVGNEGRIAFAEDLPHPALLGLQQQDFFTWGPDDDAVVYRNAYLKPVRGAKSLLQCHDQLQYTGLFEVPVGKGLLLVSQLTLGEKLQSNAVAQQLLTNMIAYGVNYRLTYRQVTACIADNAQLKKAVDTAGLQYTPVANPLLAITTPGHQVAVIDATPANLDVLAKNLPAVKQFTTNGGWIVFNNLTPDGLASYNKLVGVEHLIRPFRREKVMFSVPKSPFMSGLSLSDVALYSNEQIFSWASGNFIANDIFSYVLDYDEVASFAKFDSEFLALMTNGMVHDDAWKYIVNVPAPANPPLDFNLPLPRPEEIVRMEWIGNITYYPVTKVQLVGETDRRTFEVAPTNIPQLKEVIPPLQVQNLKLRLADWQQLPGKAVVTGLDNIRLFAKRSPEFYQKVKPLLNIGGMMAYPQGQGGIVLCNILFKDNEAVPENAGKKRLILSTILRNLKAPFSGGRTIIAGANMQYTPIDISKQANAFRDERGWFGDKTSTFKDMPKGVHTFGNVPYNIYEFATSPLPTVIMLAGANVPGNPQPLPQEVRGIPLNTKADALFFLHTARIDVPRNANEVKQQKKYELARYVVMYDDNSTVNVPIYQDFDIADYHQPTPAVLPNAQIAWSYQLPATNLTAVAIFGHFNPHSTIGISAGYLYI